MDIDKAEFDFSYDDGEDFSFVLCGKTIRGCIWTPQKEKDVNVTVICVHGLADWLTRSKDVYKVFLDRGYTVIGTDHIGHGRSDGARCSTSVEEIAEEIIMNIDVAKQHFRYNKIFIYAHSLGALATMQAALLRRTIITKKVSGIIVENPWISTGPYIGISFLKSIMFYIGSFVCPDYQADATINENTSDVPQRFIDLAQKFDNSPCHFTPKLITSVFKAITDIRSMYEMWPKDMKLFIAHAENDEVVDPVLSLYYYRDLVAHSKSDITYKRYKGHHSLTKGASRKEVLTDYIKFIENVRKIPLNKLKKQ